MFQISTKNKNFRICGETMNNNQKGLVCGVVAISILFLNALFTKIPIFFIGLSIGIAFGILEFYYFGIIKKKDVE